MRVFTQDEKTLLIRISNGSGRNLYSLIDPWIRGVSFQVNIITNSVDFIFEVTPGLNLIERLEEIQTIVIQSVNLIKLFEDKGYIFTYINANQLPPNQFTFGQAAVNVPSIPYHFPDPRISEMFCEYSTKEIFVTPELNKFISDGFITREEFRANRQWKTTRAALWTAIIALLFNMIFNFYNTFVKNPDKIKKGKQIISNTDTGTIKTGTDTTVKVDTLIRTTTILTNVKIDTIKNE
jgi:hypothetical protein